MYADFRLRNPDTYAEWYREHEQPHMTDLQFLAADEYVISLGDFRARFGPPQK